ncbi:signal peptide peptidase SppA [Aurantivibrio infirmus]
MNSQTSAGPIRKIFSFIGGTINWFRIVVINLVFLMILILIISALTGGGLEPIPDKAPLRLQISGMLVDQRGYVDPLGEVLSSVQGGTSETVVREVIQAIDAGAKDDRVSALILDLQFFGGGGISKLEEIGEALLEFKTTGKEVIATSDLYLQNQYYLASYADRVYLNPMGSVLLLGYGSYRNYYKEALDKLDVNMHIFRVGEFKDAVEPYTRNDMSDESREHNSQWINQLWGIYTSRVETQRQLPTDAINDYINNYGNHLANVNGDAAQLALSSRLVDKLATRDDIRKEFIEEFGQDKKGSYLAIDYKNYIAHLNLKPSLAKNKIGLIVARGTIYDGKQQPGNIGSETLSLLIRQAREKNVDALVLRIDSGGGSAFASEIIRNEITAMQNANIPVVVSMGSVAASGGYWIAANADEIWATPTTLTGSIGVFSMIPTLENSLDKLGVSTDGIGTTELSNAMRIDMPLSDATAQVLQQNADFIYSRFIGLVAEGRGKDPAAVDNIAQGRVWSGISAQEFGLVDKLGYLDDAIEAAANKINSEDYSVELIEQTLSPFEQFVQQLSFNVKTSIVASIVERMLGSHSFDSANSGIDSDWLSVNNFSALNTNSALNPRWQMAEDFLRLIQASRNSLDVYAHCLQCISP